MDKYEVHCVHGYNYLYHSFISLLSYWRANKSSLDGGAPSMDVDWVFPQHTRGQFRVLLSRVSGHRIFLSQSMYFTKEFKFLMSLYKKEHEVSNVNIRIPYYKEYLTILL